jgi:hypothetical protein
MIWNSKALEKIQRVEKAGGETASQFPLAPGFRRNSEKCGGDPGAHPFVQRGDATSKEHPKN